MLCKRRATVSKPIRWAIPGYYRAYLPHTWGLLTGLLCQQGCHISTNELFSQIHRASQTATHKTSLQSIWVALGKQLPTACYIILQRGSASLYFQQASSPMQSLTYYPDFFNTHTFHKAGEKKRSFPVIHRGEKKTFAMFSA